MSRPAPVWCSHCLTGTEHPEAGHTGRLIDRRTPDVLAVELTEPLDAPLGPEIAVTLPAFDTPAVMLTAEECRALADALMLAATLTDERTPTRCPACRHRANLTAAGLCLACEIATLDRPERD